MRLFLAIVLTILSATLASAEDERIWLDNIKVDGKDVRMAFDSGAGSLCLTSQAVKRLGLKVVTPPTNGVGATAVYTFEFEGTPLRTSFTILQFGGNVIPDLDGLVGWGNLHSGVCRIDAEAQKLSPLSKIPAGVQRWTQLPIDTNSGTLDLIIPGKHKGLDVITLDTGGVSGIVLTTREWKRWKRAHPHSPLTLRTITTAFGVYVCQESWADQIQIGPLVVYDVPVMEGGPFSVNAFGSERDVLGFDALRRLNLVVDGIHGVAYVRAKQTPPPLWSYNRLGAEFYPTAAHSNDLVGQVVKGGPAYEAGIRNGDILLKIDGQSVSGWTNGWKESDPDAFSMPAGTKMQLTLQRRRKVFETTATLREIWQPSQRKYEAIDDSPGLSELNAEVYFEQGDECETRGDLNGALTNADKAIESDPNLGDAYTLRAFLEQSSSNRDAAMADYNKAINLGSGIADAFGDRGMLEQTKGDVTAALADYNKAIELKPDCAEIYVYRGSLEQSRTNSDAAIADYEKALKLKPALPGVGSSLAQLYDFRGSWEQWSNEYDAAITDYEKALQLMPDLSDSITNLAQLYAYRGALERWTNDLDAAVADYGKALQLEPDLSGAKSNLAETFGYRGFLEMQTNRLDASFADFNKAIELGSDLPVVYTDRGWVDQQQGNSNAAIADYSKGVELNTNYTDAYLYRACLEQTMGKTNAALADYDRVIQLDPHSADSYLNRSSIEGSEGDLDRSEADCAQVAKLDPNMAVQAGQGFRDLGDNRFQRFEYTNALADFHKACELSPSDDYAYIGIWLCSSSLGNSEEATKDLKAYLRARDAKKSGDWQSEIGRFLVGSITERDLLSAARNADAEKDKGQRCEGYYYIGSRRLIAGDKAGATAYFEKCLSTGATEFWEFRFAKADLQTLETAGASP